MEGNRRKKNLLIGLGLLGTLTLGVWFFLLAPRLSTAQDLLLQTQSIEDLNLSQQHRFTELTKMAKDAPEAALRVQTLLSRMPQEADLPQLFTQITEAAAKAGISADKISAIAPSVPKPLDDPRFSATGPVADAQQSAQRSNIRVATLDVTVTVTGTMRQIREYVSNIENLDRDFLITGLTITNQQQEVLNGVQSASITATTFVLQTALPDLVKNVDEMLACAVAKTGVIQGG